MSEEGWGPTVRYLDRMGFLRAKEAVDEWQRWLQDPSGRKIPAWLASSVAPERGPNKGCCLLPVFRGGCVFLWVEVEAEMFEKLAIHRWSAEALRKSFCVRAEVGFTRRSLLSYVFYLRTNLQNKRVFMRFATQADRFWSLTKGNLYAAVGRPRPQ